MRIGERHLEELRVRGFTVVEDFVGGDDLRAAQEGVLLDHPSPAALFDDAELQRRYGRSQFAGLRYGPASSFAVNRLAFHPDLVDLAERFLGSPDLHLYKIELWAKYSGLVDYDQTHHRDFANHSIVVPDARRPWAQLTTFILLSDVTEQDGPTKVVPLEHSAGLPLWPERLDAGAFADVEVSITGPAGTLFAYRTDVFHRGSSMTGERRHRFAMLADYQLWGTRWAGKIAWPNQALNRGWTELIVRASPRERCLFGFPAPGDDYWTEQTRADVTRRYPGIDLSTYA